MDKRFITFFAIALPIYLLGIFYVQNQQKQYRAKLAAYEEKYGKVSGPSGDRSTTATATSTGATTGTATLAAAQPDLASADESFAASQPRAGQREERPSVPPIVITTESFRVELSPLGAVPAKWEIIDARFSHVNQKQRATGEDENGSIALIDPKLDEMSLDRPLELVLKEQNARFYNEINSDPYQTDGPKDEGDSIVIRFASPQTESGLRIVKVYRFPKQGFVVDLQISLENASASRLSFNHQGNGLGVALGPGLGVAPKIFGRLTGSYEFTAGIYQGSDGLTAVHPAKPGQVEILKDPGGGNIGWGGIQNRYFVMALVQGDPAAPKAGFLRGKAQVDPAVVDAGIASPDAAQFYPRVELYGDAITLEPGQRTNFDYKIYAGPKERKTLKATGLGLERLLFYDSWGWMRALCFLLMSMLTGFHSLLKSWGLAILALVVTVRLVTFPIAHAGLKSQAKMMAEQQKLKPEMDKINQKYKDDPTKRSQETMKLYREHNVNPFGMLKGCGWMIIQLPVFFGLYKLLSQSIDLRGASFLWIDDLSQPDRLFALGMTIPLIGATHFNLLPLLVAGSQFVTSKLSFNPNAISDANQAAMQKQMMYMMPFMMLFMTYSFPSGLALYWLVSNIWQIFQQQFVNKKILPQPVPAARA